MAKIDLYLLSIEELAALRDNATEKLAEKVAARQAELESELLKLSVIRQAREENPGGACTRESQKERRCAKEERRDEGTGRQGRVAKAA